MLGKISRKKLLELERGNSIDLGEKKRSLRESNIIRWAHGYPDLYSVGMRCIGYQLIYFKLNEREDVFCERFFKDYDATLETNSSLNEFDVVSFNLHYELMYPTVLKLLSENGVPIFSKKRNKPLLVGGGVCASYNPEPLAPFFDVVVIGDAEPIINEFVRIYKENKNAKKEKLLKRLSRIRGMYVPSLYELEYKDRRIESIRPKKEAKEEVKRLKANINYVQPFIVSPIMEKPNYAGIEIMRGCGGGCRFCMLGYAMRPPRFKDLEAIKSTADRISEYTDKVRLIAPSVSEHPKIEEILSYLKRLDFEVITGSERADSLDRKFLSGIDNEEITLAPETSQDLRYRINKRISDKDFLSSIKLSDFNEFRNLRLYMIVGFPFEEQEDIEEIGNMVKKFKQTLPEGVPIRMDVNCHIKKPFTPFQWSKQPNYEEYIKKIRKLKEFLDDFKNIKVFNMSKRQLLIEGILNRGDRVSGKILYDAYRLGDSNKDWLRALKINNRSLNDYTRRRDLDEILPWEIIDSGVSKGYLIQEYKKAKQKLPTPSCKVNSCRRCGVCNEELLERLFTSYKR